MEKNTRKSYIGHRDTKTGQFVSSQTAKRRPTTTKGERIPIPGGVSPKSAKVIKNVSTKYSKALGRLAKR